MRIVVVSGYFNPIHSGHLDYLEAAKKLGDYLIVIVNNDFQVSLKGSVPFMPSDERLRIVASLSCVDKAVLSDSDDQSVVSTLKKLYEVYSLDYFFQSMTFANGGDRTEGNSPEEQYCKQNGIRLSYDCGGGKTNSSSELLEQSKIRNV